MGAERPSAQRAGDELESAPLGKRTRLDPSLGQKKRSNLEPTEHGGQRGKLDFHHTTANTGRRTLEEASNGEPPEASDGQPLEERLKVCEAMQQVELGSSALHATHALWYQRGIVICPRCFAFGSTAPRKLLAECQGRPQHMSRCQREVWARISDGKSPRDNVVWPRGSEEARWQLLRPAATEATDSAQGSLGVQSKAGHSQALLD